MWEIIIGIIFAAVFIIIRTKIRSPLSQITLQPKIRQMSQDSLNIEKTNKMSNKKSQNEIHSKKEVQSEILTSPERNFPSPPKFRKALPNINVIRSNMKFEEMPIVNLNPIMPNYNFLVKQKIFQLYDISCRTRGIDDQWARFIGPIQKHEEFYNWYSDDNEKLKRALQKVLIGYRRVRGDGNCYYTSVVFQYFQIVLTKYTDTQFKQLIDDMQQMQFQINYKSFCIEESLQNGCARILAQQLEALRCEPLNLFPLISDPDQEFYGLSIIYLKNIANMVYKKDSLIRNINQPDLTDEILTWEWQCNNTEMLHSTFAKYLDLQQFYLIQQNQCIFCRQSEE